MCSCSTRPPPPSNHHPDPNPNPNPNPNPSPSPSPNPGHNPNQATASVDLEADELIQVALRTQLDGVSVITIAHRLDTIMHGDRVAVCEGGKVAEIGPPLQLKDKSGSLFGAMCAKAAA